MFCRAPQGQGLAVELAVGGSGSVAVGSNAEEFKGNELVDDWLLNAASTLGRLRNWIPRSIHGAVHATGWRTGLSGVDGESAIPSASTAVTRLKWRPKSAA